jgi:high-affinity Fe2+/Pb2+ permease
VVVGSLLLILGLQWLKKALLRIARPRTKKRAPIEGQPLSPESIDWYAFVVAFKAVLLEGLEIAFIVVTFGAEANQIGTAIIGALAALVVFRYLDEQSYRYNNREKEMGDYDRFKLAASQIVGKRLTWNEVTGKNHEAETYPN